MSKCSSIDPFVTSYVDNEIGAIDRQTVDEHLRRCPPCRSRMAAEAAVRRLCDERRAALRAECAPHSLHEKCSELAKLRTAGGGRPVRTPFFARARVMPFALAAALTLMVGGALLYQVTSASNRVMAAELTADHVKCFAMNAILGTRQSQEAVQQAMASGFGWPAQLPQGEARAGLELVGSRPCLYGEGRIAHIMYLHNGEPVSLFMLPKAEREDDLIHVFGHEAAIWSVGDRTFVLVARETRADLERLANFVKTSVR